MSTARAPVALFAYRRPELTRRTLTSLAANDGAADTDLIVFADGARDHSDRASVNATRQVVTRAKGFKSVEIVDRPRNIGRTENITGGVTQVMNRYGRAIVLEDDIETARGFLDFMHAGLSAYSAKKRVWHVSGWTYPIAPNGLPDAYFWPGMTCRGWASWADRWKQYRREPDRLVQEWSREQKRDFNLGGAHDFFAQVEDNASGRQTTWSVFWHATMFEAEGLCLSPTRSFTRTIALDGNGKACVADPEDAPDLARPFDGALPEAIATDPEALARIRAHLAQPIHRRLSRRIKRRLRSLLP